MDYFSKKATKATAASLCVPTQFVARARERGIEDASDDGIDGVGDGGDARAMVRFDEGLAYDASRMVRARERSLDDDDDDDDDNVDERKRYRGDGDDGRF